MPGEVWFALGMVALALAALVGAFAWRMMSLARRGGTIQCTFRTDRQPAERVGLAMMTPAELRLYPQWSLSPRPAARAPRGELELLAHERENSGGVPIVATTFGAGTQRLHLRLEAAALSGIVGWLEGGPPKHPQVS